jgi:hypothetical protein
MLLVASGKEGGGGLDSPHSAAFLHTFFSQNLYLRTILTPSEGREDIIELTTQQIPTNITKLLEGTKRNNKK